MTLSPEARAKAAVRGWVRAPTTGDFTTNLEAAIASAIRAAENDMLIRVRDAVECGYLSPEAKPEAVNALIVDMLNALLLANKD